MDQDYASAINRFNVSRAGFLHGPVDLDFSTLQTINAETRTYLVRGKDLEGNPFVAIIKGDKMDTYTLQEWEVINRLAGTMLQA